MGDCGNYDNQMAIILGEGVLQAYNYYQAWANDQSYQIKLGKYTIVDIISVFEAFGASDVAKARVPALKTQFPAPKARAEKRSYYPEWYFAGHSLGGALISLSALDAVANNWFDARTLPATTVYTYGSLHVGDQGFATAFAKQVPQAYRVANLADWVPSLVGLEADVPGYVHVGLPVTFLWQKDGDWANHNMKDTYLRTLKDFSRVLQCGERLYPQ